MSKKLGTLVAVILMLFLAGAAQAQEYGKRRLSDLENLSLNLRNETRAMYLTAEREFPQFSSDRYVVSRLYRVYDASANFQKQMEKNYNDPDALRRAFQRLYSAWYDADYIMRTTNRFGYLNDEFRTVSVMVHRLGRNLPGYSYQDDGRYPDDDYDDD